MESPPSPPQPFPSFNNLPDYIPLVDTFPLPSTNFLPTTNALALHDRRGRDRNIPAMHDSHLSDIDEGDEMPEDAAIDIGDTGASDDAVEAILEEGVAMQRHTSK